MDLCKGYRKTREFSNHLDFVNIFKVLQVSVVGAISGFSWKVYGNVFFQIITQPFSLPSTISGQECIYSSLFSLASGQLFYCHCPGVLSWHKNSKINERVVIRRKILCPCGVDVFAALLLNGHHKLSCIFLYKNMPALITWQALFE